MLKIQRSKQHNYFLFVNRFLISSNRKVLLCHSKILKTNVHSRKSQKGKSDIEESSSNRKSQLERSLEEISTRNSPREVSVMQPYPTEWDSIPYPSKFKFPILQTFNGNGST